MSWSLSGTSLKTTFKWSPSYIKHVRKRDPQGSRMDLKMIPKSFEIDCFSCLEPPSFPLWSQGCLEESSGPTCTLKSPQNKFLNHKKHSKQLWHSHTMACNIHPTQTFSNANFESVNDRYMTCILNPSVQLNRMAIRCKPAGQQRTNPGLRRRHWTRGSCWRFLCRRWTGHMLSPW